MKKFKENRRSKVLLILSVALLIAIFGTSTIAAETVEMGGIAKTFTVPASTTVMVQIKNISDEWIPYIQGHLLVTVVLADSFAINWLEPGEKETFQLNNRNPIPGILLISKGFKGKIRIAVYNGSGGSA